jgi:hypothetical protein
VNVTAELLPEHPILALVAAETDRTLGIHNGETIAFRCVECGAADEDCMEIIHEDGCGLATHTAPTAYADRPTGPLPETGGARPHMRTDGEE